MKLLATIREQDVFPNAGKKTVDYKTRTAARAVVFTEDGKTILIFAAKSCSHTLPGGGVDEGETLLDGVAREILEETGFKRKIIGEVGRTIEYRDTEGVMHENHCYLAQTIGKSNGPTFDEAEIQDGCQVQYASLDEAIKLLENDEPTKYEGKFIQKRELIFLKKARQIINNK